MKKTRVLLDNVLKVVKDHGLDVNEKAAYYKCTFGTSPAKIYVAKTKKVTRVKTYGISGKSSRSELDFTQDEATVLNLLSNLCDSAKQVPQRQTKQPRAKQNSSDVNVETEE